jgi:hypothetical protein
VDDLDAVEWSSYDFIDLGCSSGGSIKHCMKRFEVERGIGIDLDPRKVASTQEAGYDAVVADASSLSIDRQVSFVSALDFFEHLPDLVTVERILGAAARSARDFLFIRHPSFEGQEQVEALGLRQYWWHWHGHTAHVRVADYCSMFDRLGLGQYMIRYVERIESSSHPSLIPTSMPIDQTADDAAEITEKPRVGFSPPLWRHQDIFVALRAVEPEEWNRITRPTAGDRKVMRESGQLPSLPVAEETEPRSKPSPALAPDARKASRAERGKKAAASPAAGSKRNEKP